MNSEKIIRAIGIIIGLLAPVSIIGSFINMKENNDDAAKLLMAIGISAIPTSVLIYGFSYIVKAAKKYIENNP